MKNNNTLMDYYHHLLAIGASIEAALQNHLIGLADYLFTWIRDFQVGAAVLSKINRLKAHVTHQATDSADDHTDLYNKLAHHPDGSLTRIGHATIGIMVGSITVGLVRAIYQHFHEKKRISVDRLAEHEAAVKAEGENTHLSIVHELSNGADEVVINDYDGIYKIVIVHGHSNARRYLHVRRRDDMPFSNETLQAALNATKRADTHSLRFLHKLRLKAPESRNQYNPLWWINMIANSKIGSAINSVWNFCINSSMIYWIAWYFAVVATSSTIAMSAPVLTITVGITAALSLTLAAWKLAHMINNGYRTYGLRKNVARLVSNRDAILSKNITAEQKIVLLRLIDLSRNELNNHQRKKYAVKQISDAYEKIIADEKAARKNIRDQWIQDHFMTFEHAQNKHRAGIHADDNLAYDLTESEANEDITQFKTHLQQHLLFRYNTHSTKNIRAHAALGVIRDMIVGFAIPFFVFSLFAAIALLAPHTAIMIAITSALNNTHIITYIGVTLAAMIGIKSTATARRGALDYHKTIMNKLNAEVMVRGIVMTKQDYFLRLEKKLQAKLRAVNNHEGAKARIKAAGYPLEKINVYHDDYFQKQRTGYGKWVTLKKKLNRLLDFTGGSQTGILLTRFIFLSGMIAGGALTFFTFGAPLAFISIAIAAGIVVGGMRFVHAQLQRRKEKSLHFAETIDQRITYMKNRVLELQGFMNEAPHLINPAPTDRDDAVPVNAPPAPALKMHADTDIPGRKARIRATTTVPVEKTEVTLEAVKPHPVSVLAKNVHSIFSTRPRLQQSELATRPSAAPVA